MAKNDKIISGELKFYAENVSKIEIFKDGSPQFNFFPILPFCKFNSEYPKDLFLENVNRTNAKTK